MKMKALSVWQPWAWLLVNINPKTGQAWKPVENRKWWKLPGMKECHKGPLAIHASKTFDKDAYEWVKATFPEIPLPAPEEFELGGLVGIVTQVGYTDFSYSAWFFGPFGHLYKDARPITFIPVRGQQGYFNVEVPEI